MDAIERSAVAGARVTFLDGGQVCDSAVSDASGVFDIDVAGWLPKLLVNAKGYARWEGEIAAEGQETVIALDVAVVVEGVAVDDSGNPVDEAEIHVLDVERWWPLTVSSTVVTSLDGRFAITDAPSGVLELLAEHPRLTDGRVALGGTAAGRRHENVRVTLSQTGAVSGVVRDERGQSIAALVEWREALHSPSQVDESVMTGDDGRFVLHLPPGSGGVFAEVTGVGAGFTPAHVIPGGTAVADVSLVRARAIAGRVVDVRGVPVAGATITAYIRGSEVENCKAISDAAGRFEILVETRDDVVLIARLRFAIGSTSHVWEGEDDVVIRLSPVVRVRFRLVDAAGAPYRPQAFVSAMVRGSIVDWDGDEPHRGPPGEWFVTVDTGGIVEKTKILVPPSPLEQEVTIRVLGQLPPGGRVTGRVVGPDREPVAGARISFVVPRRDDRPLGDGGAMEWNDAVHSSAAGRFSLEVPSGIQRLFVFHPELRSELPVVTVPARGTVDAGDIRLSRGAAESYVMELTGIGVSSYRDHRGKSLIYEVIAGLPADRAGIVEGDVITGIDGERVEPLDDNEVRDRLEGIPGSVVSVEIEREGVAPFTVELVRETLRK